MKRVFDLLCVLGSAVFWLPLLLVLAVLVRVCIGSPIFFRQQRPGLSGFSFGLLKYRTMNQARDAQGNLLSDAQRLTRLGRFQRSSSLDELPELFNVLKGDISLLPLKFPVLQSLRSGR